MFEKEVTGLCCSTCKAEVSCKEKCECWTFAKKGAEFGYNKANKWHDLRNNPNDLPEPHTTVLDENSDKVEYIGYGKWQAYSEYYERYCEVDPPTAWCKIPTFKE